MAFSDVLDSVIAPFAPGWAAERMASRARLEASQSARDGIRQYDAAAKDRRTQGWNRPASSADGENAQARQALAWAGHDLVRKYKYATIFRLISDTKGAIRPLFCGFPLSQIFTQKTADFRAFATNARASVAQGITHE